MGWPLVANPHRHGHLSEPTAKQGGLTGAGFVGLVVVVFVVGLDTANGVPLWSAMANLLDEADQKRVLTLLNDTKFELEDLSRLIPQSNHPAHKVLDRALANVSAVVKEMYQREMFVS
jgi:hypothetical protein